MPLPLTVAALVLASSLVSCRGRDAASDGTASAAAEPPPRRQPASREAGEHWVQDQELRGVMQDLSLKLQRNAPQGVPEDPEDAADPNDLDRSFRQAQQLADGLAAAAVRIPASVDGAKMGEARYTEFRRVANTLRDHAFSLGEAARAKSIERMQRELVAVNSACIDCHRQFRDFAGLIEFPRAAAD